MDDDRLRSLFLALHEAGVDYAVFGAVALGLHGLARATADLCGDYPAVRYVPPDGFSLDILTRIGEAFRPVRVVSPRTLWRMKKGTVRPTDRYDADVLAERFGFREE